MKKTGTIYVVAGDEMQKLMKEKYPERETVPFREDLSKGTYNGFDLDPVFMARRASLWNVPVEEYEEKISPITGIDLSRDIVLVFGEDECCRANLSFMIGYLKGRGYRKPVKVEIVDEYDLNLKNEYHIVLKKKEFFRNNETYQEVSVTDNNARYIRDGRSRAVAHKG